MSIKHIFRAIKKKHIIVATVITLSLITFIVGFSLYRSWTYKVREKGVIEKWNIVLPEKRAIKYAMRATHMDGRDTYLVYKLKKEPTSFLASFSQNNNYPLLSKEIEKSADDIITAVKNGGWLAPRNKIPEKYLPDWSKDYYFKYSKVGSWEEYYMVYFPQASLLVVCERCYR